MICQNANIYSSEHKLIYSIIIDIQYDFSITLMGIIKVVTWHLSYRVLPYLFAAVSITVSTRADMTPQGVVVVTVAEVAGVGATAEAGGHVMRTKTTELEMPTNNRY